jgi:hypothetical protein
MHFVLRCLTPSVVFQMEAPNGDGETTKKVAAGDPTPDIEDVAMSVRATCRQTVRLDTPGLVTTMMAMRCEGGVCVVSILLDMIFVKT